MKTASQSYSTRHSVSSNFLHRKKTIEENMRRMPQMIEDYRKQRRQGREAMRRSKEKTAEQKYLLASGKMKDEGPHWKIFRDSKR